MPKLWTETIDGHRRRVRDTILETAASLVADRGLRAVTMSQIAAETGIGRATLYKYFADVEAILVAWHEREIARHLDRLARVRDEAPRRERLAAILESYASVCRASGGHDPELGSLLHSDRSLAGATARLHQLIREALVDSVAAGDVRDDVPADELATYCVHSLGAARQLRSRAAVERLVALTLAAVRAR